MDLVITPGGDPTTQPTTLAGPLGRPAARLAERDQHGRSDHWQAIGGNPR
jgi:hypothetical protein